jgi:hypothetical protein
MPESVARKLLQGPRGEQIPYQTTKGRGQKMLVREEDKTRFLGAMVGGNVFCPFQCELFHFRNLQGRSPMYGVGVLDDTETMELIRRAILDAFWSGEPANIGHN